MNDKPLLKTPGEMISEAREAQDLTINQLSERTKIPPPVLSALELDEYHKISGPLYIKSFLRTCATDLGLDPETVMGLYNKISGVQEGGGGGIDMVWEDEKVQVSRIGLPWVQIILVVGIVAVLAGVGLFGLRGCGGDEEEGSQRQEELAVEADLPAAGKTTPVFVAEDSSSGGDPRRESLIPPSADAELKDKSEVVTNQDPEKSDADPETFNILADTLSLGWMLSPAPPIVEQDIPSAKEIESVDVVKAPVIRKDEPSVSGGSPEVKPEETPEIVPVEIIRFEPEPEAAVEDKPGALPVADDWIDSAWPLVLRLVCDTPQRIRVKRDGDREFSEVSWPVGPEVAPEVPDAGFEAGRAYRQGDRLVVFWGAEDHFSLVLARVRGVEVAVNGRIRVITNLKAGQELILDSHSAGYSVDR